ncbi:MAG: hypothetical protein ACRCYU_20745 [Nocardioides sp.]
MSSVGLLPWFAGVLLTGGLVGASADEVTRFVDPEIVESSGLVATDDSLITTNDSGDIGRLFVVDSRTGETVRQVPWSADPVDVEALAPAIKGGVWVGDIGDNNAERSEVAVALVDPAGVESTVSYRLRYPAGPADAETLLAHPRTGQLFVVTKSVVGGTFLAAPARLSAEGVTTLTDRGSVAGLITDGAFFPNARHLIVRNYSRAFVYAFPTLDLIGEFDLPEQEQGEGLAVAGPDSVYVSSEGVNAPVVRVELPASIRSAMRRADQPGPADGIVERNRGTDATPSSAPETAGRTWVWPLAGSLGALVVLWAGRALRRRRLVPVRERRSEPRQ